VLLPWESGVSLIRLRIADVGLPLLLILLLGPVSSAIAFARRFLSKWPPTTPPRLALLGAVVAGAIGGLETHGVVARTRGVGGPLVVAGAALLVVGWLAVGLGSTAGRDRRGWLVAAGVAAVLVAVAGVAVVRVSVLQPTDHTTASALSPPADAGTATAAARRLDLTQRRWQLHEPTDSDVIPAGRYLVLYTGDSQKVTVVDAGTGRERWHYRHSDVSLLRISVSQDKRTLALLFARDGNTIKLADEGFVLAFDLASGRQLWDRGASGIRVGPLPDTNALQSVGDVIVVSQENIASHAVENDLVAWDERSGARRWRWPVPAGCHVVGVAGGPAALVVDAVGSSCAMTGELVFLSAADGRTQIWRPPPGAAVVRDGDSFPTVPLVAERDGFLTAFPSNGAKASDWVVMRFDPMGTPLSSRPLPLPLTPDVVAASGSTLFSAAITSGPLANSSYTVEVAGIDLTTGQPRYRRTFHSPSNAWINPAGETAYMVTGPGQAPNFQGDTITALRIADGTTVGQTPGVGVTADDSTGVVVVWTPDSSGTVLTGLG